MVVAQDQKVIDALVTLLESNAGYQIGFFGGLLSLSQGEAGRFTVNRIEYDAETRISNWIFEETFGDPREAAEWFERKRREYQLGFDIERELNQ